MQFAKLTLPCLKMKKKSWYLARPECCGADTCICTVCEHTPCWVIEDHKLQNHPDLDSTRN